jgi:hypothetical protein
METDVQASTDEEASMSKLASWVIAAIGIAVPGGLRSQDCNGDGIDDPTAIVRGLEVDCDRNGVPDECELSYPIAFVRERTLIVEQRLFWTLLANLDADPEAELASLRRGEAVLAIRGLDGASRLGLDLGQPPLSLAAGDVDGDGAGDVVALHWEVALAIRCRWGDGRGGFSEPDETPIPETESEFPWLGEHPDIVLFDPDGDGDLDVAATSAKGPPGRQERAISIFENLGSRRFQPRFFAIAVDYTLFGPMLGLDRDGDGRSELGFKADLGVFHWFRWREGGIEESIETAPVPPGFLELADFDGDGRIDFVRNFEPDFVSPPAALEVYLAGPDSSYTQRLSLKRPGERLAVLLSDYDGDGRTDLVAYLDSLSTRAMIFFRNVPAGALDCDGDRVLDACQADDDFDRVADACEMLADPDLDCDGSGRLDAVELHPRLSFEYPTFVDAGAGPYSFSSFAAADFDGDGDVDIAGDRRRSFFVGNSAHEEQYLATYFNDGDGVERWSASEASSFVILGIESGDLDGDGDVDVAAVAVSPDAIVVWTNPGDGRFSAPRSFAGKGPIALADFDGDGGLDVAGGAGVVRGFSRGGFEVAYEPADAPYLIDAGDLDADGDLDLLEAVREPPRLRLRFNDGAGGFARAEELALEPSLRDLAAADLDGDGASEILAAGGRRLAVLGRGAGGAFGLRGETELDAAIASLLTLDVDGDGDLDLAAGHAGSSFAGNDFFSLTVLRNRGDGGWEGRESYDSASWGSSFRASDHDGDGRADLLVRAYEPGRELSIAVVRGLDGGAFEAPRGFRAGPAPSAMVRGDIDADGRMDLLLTRLGSRSAGIFWGPSAAGAGAATEIDLENESPGAALFDADADGDLDLALAQPGGVAFLRNQGGRRFAAGPALVAFNEVEDVHAADFDGDGDRDLLALGRDVERPFLATLSVFRNRGDGAFDGARNLALPNAVRAIAVFDIDGDGDADVAVAQEDAPSLLLASDGASLSAAGEIEIEAAVFGLRAADLDGDGDQDLVAGRFHLEQASLYENLGGLRFEARGRLSTLGTVIALDAGDLDGDGRLDLLLAGPEGEVSVFSNAGGWSFHGPAIVRLGSGLVAFALLDLDGDRDLDVVSASGSVDRAGSFGALSMLLNDSAPPPGADADGDGRLDRCEGGIPFRRGDADQDGTVGLTDAVRILGRLFLARELPPCDEAADVNDDGALNLTDPVRLLDYLFRAQAPPPPPFARCGRGEDGGALGCIRFDACPAR